MFRPVLRPRTPVQRLVARQADQASLLCSAGLRSQPMTTAATASSPAAAQQSPQDGLNGWAGPGGKAAGTAAFDFRSDVVTRPTRAMLEAIARTTLLDDDYAEDPTTNALERWIAQLTGHEAALLVMSGTMGNQIAIRTHLQQPPYQVLADHRAHILHWEAGGVPTWTGAYVKGIIPRGADAHHLTLEDVQRHAILDEDYNGCPTRLICLENTLDGSIMPLAEVRRISEWARSHGLKLHLDGARLWDAVAAGAASSLREYTVLMDSASLCFSKGLGAPIGSILVGSADFIRKARWFRKSIGGGTRQAGIIAAAARAAVQETYFGVASSGEDGQQAVEWDETGRSGLLPHGHTLARRVADMWVARGGKLAQPVETNMVWLDLDAAGIAEAEWCKLAREKGLQVTGNRLVLHYQISEEAIEALTAVTDLALNGAPTTARAS